MDGVVVRCRRGCSSESDVERAVVEVSAVGGVARVTDEAFAKVSARR